MDFHTLYPVAENGSTCDGKTGGANHKNVPVVPRTKAWVGRVYKQVAVVVSLLSKV